MKVYEQFQVAEYVGSGSVPILGHVYSFHNDPVGHDNHVHVAHLPFWKPDGALTTPTVLHPPASEGTAQVLAFRAAVDAHFGPGAYPSGGIYVPKHRNSDPTERWSQHTGANAEDFMCDHAGADVFLAWLLSEYEEDEEMAVTNDDYEQRAFTWGMLQRWQGKKMPIKSPDLNPNKPDENFLDPAQRGWKLANGEAPPPVAN